jgi:hypothetical protein
LTPPGVRFEWGSFSFDGMVEGMEETLEFFSPEGKPLRANISLTLTAQKILPRDASKDGRNLPARPGHTPLKVARQGDSLQRMAGADGKDGWQGIAAANAIEDPLRMAPGRFVDLNASVRLGASADAGARVALDAGTSADGPNAALGGSASASVSLG